MSFLEDLPTCGDRSYFFFFFFCNNLYILLTNLVDVNDYGF